MPPANRLCNKCGCTFYSRRYNPKCPNCLSTHVSNRRESARIRSMIKGW